MSRFAIAWMIVVWLLSVVIVVRTDTWRKLRFTVSKVITVALAPFTLIFGAVVVLLVAAWIYITDERLFADKDER